MGRRGMTLMGTMVSGALIAVAVTFSALHFARQRRSQVETRRTARAGHYAVELVEMFRSWGESARLLNYLRNPAAPAAPAPLCAHVNLLNRTDGTLLNEDPAAALPVEALGATEGSGIAANRSYRVHVVDALTLQPDFSFCGVSPDALPPLGANQRFFVTVTVSWVPPGATLDGTRYVAVSTLLPR